jgi:hypothetical protein
VRKSLILNEFSFCGFSWNSSQGLDFSGLHGPCEASYQQSYPQNYEKPANSV